MEILDRAHTILGSISLVQIVQSSTRKVVAQKTIFDSAANNLRAILDMTGNTGFRFGAVRASATGTRILVPSICPTKATVHTAGSDQPNGDGV